MKISYHTWHPAEHRVWRVGQGPIGVLAIDNESGYAVAVISEPTRQANRELAEKRLRRASVLREQIAERDAEIARLRIALAKLVTDG
jgi:hypothetical protein